MSFRERFFFIHVLTLLQIFYKFLIVVYFSYFDQRTGNFYLSNFFFPFCSRALKERKISLKLFRMASKEKKKVERRVVQMEKDFSFL